MVICANMSCMIIMIVCLFLMINIFLKNCTQKWSCSVWSIHQERIWSEQTLVQQVMVWQKNCSQNEFHFLRYIHTLNYDKCFKAVDLQSFKHRLKWTNAAPARLGLLGLLFMPQKHICRWSAQPSCGFHLVDFEVSSMRLPIWRRHDPTSQT